MYYYKHRTSIPFSKLKIKDEYVKISFYFHIIIYYNIPNLKLKNNNCIYSLIYLIFDFDKYCIRHLNILDNLMDAYEMEEKQEALLQQLGITRD